MSKKVTRKSLKQESQLQSTQQHENKAKVTAIMVSIPIESVPDDLKPVKMQKIPIVKSKPKKAQKQKAPVKDKELELVEIYVNEMPSCPSVYDTFWENRGDPFVRRREEEEAKKRVLEAHKEQQKEAEEPPRKKATNPDATPDPVVETPQVEVAKKIRSKKFAKSPKKPEEAAVHPLVKCLVKKAKSLQKKPHYKLREKEKRCGPTFYATEFAAKAPSKKKKKPKKVDPEKLALKLALSLEKKQQAKLEREKMRKIKKAKANQIKADKMIIKGFEKKSGVEGIVGSRNFEALDYMNVLTFNWEEADQGVQQYKMLGDDLFIKLAPEASVQFEDACKLFLIYGEITITYNNEQIVLKGTGDVHIKEEQDYEMTNTGEIEALVIRTT